jgi:hypothetical protein
METARAINPAPRPRRPGRKRKLASVSLASSWEDPTPTPERFRHADAMGGIIQLEEFRTAAGQKTELKRRRLISPLERLWKVGVIDAGQYGAARRYQRDTDLAAVVGPSATVRYEPRMIESGSARFLLPIEAAADYLQHLAAAQSACGLENRRMLDWIAMEPLGWSEQAAQWWPAISEASREWQFKRMLRRTCASLEVHYRKR